MGGGLALLWTKDIEVEVQSCDKLHIDVEIIDPVTQRAGWRFTGFYGEARRELRYRSWDLLKLLSTRSNLPLLCAGDFNEVLDTSEQCGGQMRPERQMDGFRDAVETCGLTDLLVCRIHGIMGNKETTISRSDSIGALQPRPS